MNAMDMPAGLGDKAADTVLGQPAMPDFDADMYQLRKLADQVLNQLGGNLEERVFLGGCLLRTRFVEPTPPDLVWDDQPFEW